MGDNQSLALDRTDEAILMALQSGGRMSTADLATTVSLSPSATADLERITGRLATLGAITTNVVYSTLTGRRLEPA